MEEICKAVIIGAGGAVTVALTPAAVAALGFTSTGIAAGSVASWLMALSATAGGGGVVAGGFIATLQSIGAAGLSWSGTAVAAAAGGSLASLLSSVCNGTQPKS